jgi:fatty acid/phospholipid biosynthesis enzyme
LCHRRGAPTRPSNEDWGTPAEEELAHPPIKIVKAADFIDNDEADMEAVEKLRHISPREAAKAWQQEDEDARWDV